MSLQKFIKHDIEMIRNMTLDQIFELHRNTYHTPPDMTYDEVVLTIKDMMSKLRLILTSEQLHLAMSCGEGVPVAVESCPGSGKTTISQFIVYIDIIVHKVNPMKMLLSSFSNKSTISMQERNLDYAQKLGVDAVTCIKTMHSWYFSFLKQYLPYLGLPNHVQTLTQLTNDYEVNELLGSAYKKVTGEKYATESVLNRIREVYCEMHDKLLTMKQLEQTKSFKDLNIDIKTLDDIFKNFDMTKRGLGKVDYTDMQVWFYNLIKTNEAVRNKIANHFDAVLIDECQDTSKLQFEIYSLLLTENSLKRTRLVGDKDQQLYGWRGAMRDMFKSFFEKFPNGALVTLGYNMRSPMNVIEPANKLIAHTKGRVDKHMTSPRNLTGTTSIVPCRSRYDAVQHIHGLLKKVYAGVGSNYDIMKEHCVLIRNHSQAMWLVDALASDKIPVNIGTGKFPYNDKIIVDMIDIMRAVLNPVNAELGSKALPKIIPDVKANQSKQIMLQMNLKKKLYEIEFDVIPTKYNPNPTFAQDMENLKNICLSGHTTVSKLCQLLIPMYKAGSYDYYAKRNYVDPEHSELIFEYLLDQHTTVDQFALRISDINDSLRNNGKLDLGFKIETIHAAKGLEYDNVYFLDSSSKTCPNERLLRDYEPHDAYDYLIEERNAFYVAITRSKRNLVMTYNQFNPSIFNKESGLIQPDHIKNVKPLPKHLLEYIEKVESGTVVQGERLEQVEKLPSVTNITKNYQTPTPTKSRFKLDIRLNQQYAEVLNKLKL